jgi:hypothetical protein
MGADGSTVGAMCGIRAMAQRKYTDGARSSEQMMALRRDAFFWTVFSSSSARLVKFFYLRAARRDETFSSGCYFSSSSARLVEFFYYERQGETRRFLGAVTFLHLRQGW